MSPASLPLMYGDLARWWPLMSPPSHYEEEAADLLPPLLAAIDGKARTLLELGSGGGSLAFHLKEAFPRVTLVDLSPGMLDLSRAINPTCEHLEGDMRTVRLDRTFDAVLVHDAIMYATTEADLRAVLATAAAHCRPGGAALFMPDEVAETYAPETRHGGEDAPDGSGIRYLEWSWDADPGDSRTETLFVFALREADGTTRVIEDRHTFGLFPRASWMAWLREAGFTPVMRTDPWGREVFLGGR
jgi:SAM-dependent methyltransferase